MYEFLYFDKTEMVRLAIYEKGQGSQNLEIPTVLSL